MAVETSASLINFAFISARLVAILWLPSPFFPYFLTSRPQTEKLPKSGAFSLSMLRIALVTNLAWQRVVLGLPITTGKTVFGSRFAW
jgi:hypothetical protein